MQSKEVYLLKKEISVPDEVVVMEQSLPKCPKCGGEMKEDAGLNKQKKFVTVESCYDCDYRLEEDPYAN